MTENINTLMDLIEHMESDLKKIKALASKLQTGKRPTRSSAPDVSDQASKLP
jgi:hypothetical protein